MWYNNNEARHQEPQDVVLLRVYISDLNTGCSKNTHKNCRTNINVLACMLVNKSIAQSGVIEKAAITNGITVLRMT